ncbi:hypothetical protein [Flavivirga eckloniae]|uniref:Uncharacterized protein n=1 Tax=Flavivirga eckloniae TaxID=1803846 RepID=A0A2K9PSB8_9FLAO|nr:hypothetical protein [Flavivirga eckloniae]AUP79698.1 hypothetical protein C1H87_13665 [Flavivirga eckloniae]
MNGLKVKAGALQFTMFITVVIALLLVAFIILVNTHTQFKLQSDFVLETVENTKKGIQHALKNNIRANDTVHINLQDEDYKTVSVYKSYWGLFEKVLSTSKIKKNTVKKIALVGASQPERDRTALYIKENNRPLVVVGETKIKGMVYLPKQGVRTGNISGHSYYGSRLIYGKTRPSNKLPKLLNETLNHIKKSNLNIGNLQQHQFLDLSRSKTYRNSFFNPLQVVYSNTSINLSGISLIGHIVVQSKTKITVDANSNLKDIILIAPIIEIKNHVKGTFQAIATKNLKVGKNCKLDYPSALILNEKEKPISSPTNLQKEKPSINIDKRCNIKGVVAYFGAPMTNNFDAQIVIEENTTVVGEVYCNQNLELKGTIYGSVFTSNFVAKQSGSSYQNHIYNGTIIVDELPEEYIGLPFNNSKKGVAKWLY